MKKFLHDKTIEELKEIVAEYNQPAFRAKQLKEALFLGKAGSEITNLPKAFISEIEKDYEFEPVKIVKVQNSSDGTIKFGLSLFDGGIIEMVLMRYEYGNTLCISTQVGCRMGCAFCASGMFGLVRNLESSEMIGEVITANKYLGGTIKERKVTNIVLMGCGEPLDNYENVTKFIDVISGEFGISERNISLSTCGLVDNIYRLADDGYKVNLTISLHAPEDETRKKLMKIANRYTIDEVVKACDYYFETNKRRVYFEYTLCKGINDSLLQAKQLAHLLKGRVCHVNVINLNSVVGKDLIPCDKKHAYAFVGALEENGISATLRRTLGQDIDGACGQLRQGIMESNDEV